MNIALTPWATGGTDQAGRAGRHAPQADAPVPLRPGLPGRLEGRRDHPLAAACVLPVVALHPTFNARPVDIVFFIAIWGAYVIRSLELWMLGLVTFWTTRSGRSSTSSSRRPAVRIGSSPALMPDWASSSPTSSRSSGHSDPIEALIGQLLPPSCCSVRVQGLWIGLLTVVVLIGWRIAVRRFSAVGG